MAEDNCIFCKIARGVIPSTTVYEDEDFRVILVRDTRGREVPHRERTQHDWLG